MQLVKVRLTARLEGGLSREGLSHSCHKGPGWDTLQSMFSQKKRETSGHPLPYCIPSSGMLDRHRFSSD